ncbi:3-keto-5-aminohexanoate cleavage protein [Blastococcus sp. TF02A-26]|uniref:3-keto-5-aminohexanoate cleavage protein n=1 Tax=Blastococcus sp. TF02A-26 TaxID=2250577 RepID=UPI000DE8FE5A|nr:3-keto-5-aminohexanoate cleavage protein [Blastococcus sp. TF02A-26]RBY81869.1 3-keto-5-aminohexanoate cleavage protein [Blastococcus sp. TF02A-26]
MTSGTLVTLAPAPAAPDELAVTARDCQAVGAAVLVLPPLDAAAAGATVAAVREETDLLVQAAAPGLGADLVTVPLDLPRGLLGERVDAVLAGGAAPVFEVGALQDLDALAELAPAAAVHVSLVLGRPGGLPGTLAAVAACLERLPAGAVWSAVGAGTSALPVLLAALSAGGHVRAGTADGADGSAPGEPGRADLQLVARAAGLARIAQRPPVPPATARDLLLGPPAGLLAPRPAPHPTSVEIR